MRRFVLAAGIVLVVLSLTVGALVFRSHSPVPTDVRPAVLLVPGYGGEAAPLRALREDLQASGQHVVVLDIGDGTGDLRRYADQAVAAARDAQRTGAPAVDVVGFSAGGLVARIAALDEPGLFDRVVTLATPHQGTVWALFGGQQCPQACQQMKPGSPLLTSLPPAPNPQQWLSVVSATDQVVVPTTSAALAGSTVLTIQQICRGAEVDHGAVPSYPLVVDSVEAFLGGSPLPQTCPLQP